MLALFTWTAWLLLGGTGAVHHLIGDWKIALTMVFGFLVGDGTSEGGGAIAFPVFTRMFNISIFDARNFSFAIQSVGMGAASLSILSLRIWTRVIAVKAVLGPNCRKARPDPRANRQ